MPQHQTTSFMTSFRSRTNDVRATSFGSVSPNIHGCGSCSYHCCRLVFPSLSFSFFQYHNTVPLTMRAISNILLAFNLQSSTTTTNAATMTKPAFLDKVPSFFFRLPSFEQQKQRERTVLVQELLQEASKVGQVGSLASEEERARLVSLAEQLTSYSDPNPAMVPLDGIHELVYSAAPGASSGRISGGGSGISIVGKVSQKFETDSIF